MRSIWKGVVSFGLVTIPIRLYSATEEHDVPLHQVHEKDGARIRYRRICEAEGAEVPYGEIAKGYELPGGETIVITDEELKSLPIASSRTVEVMRFVPDEQIPGIYLNKSYYLQADGAGIKPYVLLRDALAGSGSSALVKVALRQRESLAVLRPYGDVLLLQTMLWPDEIRDAGSIAPPDDIEVRPQELQMAQSYIDALIGDFEPEEFTDEYADALRALVEAKAAGRELTKPAEPAARGGEVIDLMAALEASVAEAKASRAGKRPARTATANEDEPETDAKRASGRTTTSTAKSQAKKTAAKTTAAKTTGKTRGKTAAKRTTDKATGSKSAPRSSSAASSRSSTTANTSPKATPAEKAPPAEKAAPPKNATPTTKSGANTAAGRKAAARKSASKRSA